MSPGAAEQARILADFDAQARDALAATSAFMPESAPHLRGQLARARVEVMAAYLAGITNASPYERSAAFHSTSGGSALRSGTEHLATGPGERAVRIDVSLRMNSRSRLIVGVGHVMLGEQTSLVVVHDPRSALIRNADGHRDTRVIHGSLRDRFGR